MRAGQRDAGTVGGGGMTRRIFTTRFASLSPHCVAKAEKKGRTKAEVDAIIPWLTGCGPEELAARLKDRTDFETFLAEAVNPARADQGRGLRGPGREDPRPGDARDPLSRQAGRRTGQGEADGEDPAERVRGAGIAGNRLRSVTPAAARVRPPGIVGKRPGGVLPESGFSSRNGMLPGLRSILCRRRCRFS